MNPLFINFAKKHGNKDILKNLLLVDEMPYKDFHGKHGGHNFALIHDEVPTN